jgi:pilus assembly protein CpaE
MGSVIGIFSAKGGVGKTILATNLAVAFGVGHHRKTAILDLNEGAGSADLLLDLEPERSWEDLLPVIEELNTQQLNLAATEFRPGIDLLASPPEINWKGMLNKKNLTLLLDALREAYEIILIDAATGGALTGAALSVVDIQLITLTPDGPALRATSRFLETIKDSDLVTGLVINQQAPGAPVKPNEIQEHLGARVIGVLPIDPASVWTNISYGEPCVLRRGSNLGKAIRGISNRLLKIIDQREV